MIIQQTELGCWTPGPLRTLPRPKFYYSKLCYIGLLFHTLYSDQLHKPQEKATEDTTKCSTNLQCSHGSKQEQMHRSESSMEEGNEYNSKHQGVRRLPGRKQMGSQQKMLLKKCRHMSTSELGLQGSLVGGRLGLPQNLGRKTFNMAVIV